LKESTDTKDWVSIGEVSKQTGFSVFNLRMWERRYGAPTSLKLASGHRRYSPQEIARLRLVKKAIALKLKPSHVATMTAQDLAKIILQNENLSPTKLLERQDLEKIVTNIYAWSDQEILGQLEADWQKLGYLDFLDIRVCDLLGKIGECWEVGEMSIASEHFVSSLLETFLQNKWRRANFINSGSKFVLATLDGEKHTFGLQMAATVITAVKHNVVYLGASIDAESIASAVEQSGAAAVIISISEHLDPQIAAREIAHLRSHLPQNLPLVTGGKGATTIRRGIECFSSFYSFEKWIENVLNPKINIQQNKTHNKRDSHA